MNLTGILQKSIDYMEDHLLDDLTYDEIAQHVNMSSFQFHRTFTIVAGISASEYIRYRRLSLAGQEVVQSSRRILDIALDYGFTTNESFTKAFRLFHGVTPSVARKSGGSLNVFSPLHIKITLKGGKRVDYRIEKKEAFQLIAKVRAFDIKKINEADNHEIPDFWQEEMNQGLFKAMGDYAENTSVYGVCSPLGKDSDIFDYGIAMVYNGKAVPEDYRIWQIDAHDWAVFQCKGDTPDCIGQVWEQIISEFLPGSDYERVDTYDLEYYPEDPEEGVFCEIWIPVH